MASTSSVEDNQLAVQVVEDLQRLVWGSDIKHEVFRRWTQGFVFSDCEPTALLQIEGGPCAVIVPVQAFLIRKLLFGNPSSEHNWKDLKDEDQISLFYETLLDMFMLHKQSVDSFCLLYHEGGPSGGEVNGEEGTSTEQQEGEEKEDTEVNCSPKKQCFSHEQFHSGLRCKKCSLAEFPNQLRRHIPSYQGQYGVLLAFYSIALTKGIDQIKNELEDPGEPLIDGTFGHGSQSLVNLLITGYAVCNVWDNEKEISGMKLQGVSQQSTIGFLTLLEHLRLCEVGWYLKNPKYPIWILGSETHLTILFSQDRNLVSKETPESAGRRVFNNYDTEGSGFISAELLGDVLATLDLVSEPEYVKIMREKLDPEQLGIVTLNVFMEEFFPCSGLPDSLLSFTLYHYNGLQNSCPQHKVCYQKGTAVIMELPELQLLTDTSTIKTCLMTKWPTIELKWTNDSIPSLN